MTLVPIDASQNMTIQEAASLIGVSDRTISNWMNDGRLAFRRVGRRRVTSRAALEAACPPGRAAALEQDETSLDAELEEARRVLSKEGRTTTFSSKAVSDPNIGKHVEPDGVGESGRQDLNLRPLAPKESGKYTQTSRQPFKIGDFIDVVA